MKADIRMALHWREKPFDCLPGRRREFEALLEAYDLGRETERKAIRVEAQTVLDSDEPDSDEPDSDEPDSGARDVVAPDGSFRAESYGQPGEPGKSPGTFWSALESLIVSRDHMARNPVESDAALPVLVESLRTYGQLDPILVCESDHADLYEVVAGYRRVAAVRQLGWPTMLVKLIEPGSVRWVTTNMTPVEPEGEHCMGCLLSKPAGHQHAIDCPHRDPDRG